MNYNDLTNDIKSFFDAYRENLTDEELAKAFTEYMNTPKESAVDKFEDAAVEAWNNWMDNYECDMDAFLDGLSADTLRSLAGVVFWDLAMGNKEYWATATEEQIDTARKQIEAMLSTMQEYIVWVTDPANKDLLTQLDSMIPGLCDECGAPAPKISETPAFPNEHVDHHCGCCSCVPKTEVPADAIKVDSIATVASAPIGHVTTTETTTKNGVTTTKRSKKELFEEDFSTILNEALANTRGSLSKSDVQKKMDRGLRLAANLFSDDELPF